MTPGQVLRSAYILARNQLAAAERELSDARSAVTRHQKNRDHYKEIAEGLISHVCKECMGYGYIQISYDQDDIKSATCTKCKGSGLPKEQM